jgi:hypothetical protein
MKVVPTRDALDLLNHENDPNQYSVQKTVRDGGEGSDRQDISIEDDDKINNIPTDE